MNLYGLRPAVRWVRAHLGNARPVPSRVRRIQRVAHPGARLVAITFDDGPTRGLTEEVLESLARFEARGTFDIVGSTRANYPDRPGRRGGPFWSGRAYDHYAAFGRDDEAGLAARPELVRALAAGGHELSNHSYRHLAFGPERVVYRGRRHFAGARQALEDQRQLHEACRALTGTEPRLGRPPHYIDRTVDGFDAYDIYDAMGYQYLAANFDLGGWQPSRASREDTIAAAVAPLEAALAADPDSLAGQVLFAKDGYNMSLEPVVCWALPRQLELLARAGYRVVTVSELLAASPFADVGPEDPAAAWALRLLAAGVPCAFRDNRLRPEAPLTRGELAAWLGGPVTPPALGSAGPLVRAREVAAARGWLAPGRPEAPVQRSELERALGSWAWQASATATPEEPRPPDAAGVSHRLALARFVAALGSRGGPGWSR